MTPLDHISLSFFGDGKVEVEVPQDWPKSTDAISVQR